MAYTDSEIPSAKPRRRLGETGYTVFWVIWAVAMVLTIIPWLGK